METLILVVVLVLVTLVDITSSPQGDGNEKREEKAIIKELKVDITSSPQGDGNNKLKLLTLLAWVLTLHLPRKGMETATGLNNRCSKSSS